MNERFTINIVDENNWLIQDTLNGTDACPLDGTTKVLKALIKIANKYFVENIVLKERIKELEKELQPITLTTHISDEDFKKIERLFKIYCDGGIDE